MESETEQVGARASGPASQPAYLGIVHVNRQEEQACFRTLPQRTRLQVLRQISRREMASVQREKGVHEADQRVGVEIAAEGDVLWATGLGKCAGLCSTRCYVRANGIMASFLSQ